MCNHKWQFNSLKNNLPVYGSGRSNRNRILTRKSKLPQLQFSHGSDWNEARARRLQIQTERRPLMLARTPNLSHAFLRSCAHLLTKNGSAQVKSERVAAIAKRRKSTGNGFCYCTAPPMLQCIIEQPKKKNILLNGCSSHYRRRKIWEGEEEGSSA